MNSFLSDLTARRLSSALMILGAAVAAQAQPHSSIPSLRGIARVPLVSTSTTSADGCGTVPSYALSQGWVANRGGPYTPLQIAQSFLNADANHDGELSQAEARYLTIKPYSFYEMDRNYDGVISRFEYEDAVRDAMR